MVTAIVVTCPFMVYMYISEVLLYMYMLFPCNSTILTQAHSNYAQKHTDNAVSFDPLETEAKLEYNNQ